MPLMTETPPSGHEKVLEAAVAELVGHGALALGTKDQPVLSAPIRVFNLGADAIASGGGLAAAQPTGWLSTLTTNGEVRGSLELVPQRPARKAAAGAGLRMGSFTTGPLHRALAAAVEAAHRSAGRSKVQVAIVRVPALYLMALWLKDEDGADRLVPVAPCPPPLKAGEAVAADPLLAALREQAANVAKPDDARN